LSKNIGRKVCVWIVKLYNFKRRKNVELHFLPRRRGEGKKRMTWAIVRDKNTRVRVDGHWWGGERKRPLEAVIRKKKVENLSHREILTGR